MPWLIMSSDHRAENAVQLEVRSNLGGGQAWDGCRCLRSNPCWRRSQLVFTWGLTRLRRPADIFLPSWRQILTLIGFDLAKNHILNSLLTAKHLALLDYMAWRCLYAP